MKINFNGKDKKNTEHTKFMKGDFEQMQKQRKKAMLELQEVIQEAFENYNGESFCIVIQREDENGMPDHAQVVMGGVSRPESQVALGKALHQSSHKAIEVVLDAAKESGDIRAMLTVAAAVAGIMKEND